MVFLLANLILDLLIEKQRLLFVDGSGVYSNNFKRAAMGRTGQRPTSKKLKTTYQRNYMATIDKDKLVSLQCSKKGMNSQQLSLFCEQTLIYLEREADPEVKPYFIILDNCSGFKTKGFLTALSRHNVKLLFSLPSFPLLNFVEVYFMAWKRS